MTPITSDKDPTLELIFRQSFAVSQHESNEEIIRILRKKTAHILAEKVMAEQRFFDLRIERGYGELKTNVIVMTVDEFFAWSHRKFKEGFDHAQGYMPRDWELKP